MTYEQALTKAHKETGSDDPAVLAQQVCEWYNYHLADSEQEAQELFGMSIAEAKAIFDQARQDARNIALKKLGWGR